MFGDCGWLLRREGSLTLERREGFVGPLTRLSGALMSLEPLDTRRVCRRGEGLFSEDFRDMGKISSFNGDGGRWTGLDVVWYELKMVCRGGLAETMPLANLGGGVVASGILSA